MNYTSQRKNESKVNTLSKQYLKAWSGDLNDRLDKVIDSIYREFDLGSSERISRLKKARTLREDLKNLEPAIDAIDHRDFH